ncbi:MAG: hypothetical protein SRB2_04065 [Desulfobacteraceae bacterium Eth-SRB2]|nr:MAG: hypothetical protein SRB2_04065 [Desulfobacteraceae bacterium Eth-SRB2]
MTPWYKSNQKLFREERAALAFIAPLLGMVIASPGFRLNSERLLKHESAVAFGTYGISVPDSAHQIEYRISILMPIKYPKEAPNLLCNDPKLPIGNIDHRHIMKDGSACLGVYADIMMRWSLKSGIVNFLENFVAPFLVWQAYFDAHQKPPLWGDRSHFAEGIIEYYTELLGINRRQSVVEFMRLLARKTVQKVMKYVHAAPVRGFEIVTGNCFTGPVRKLHGSMLPKICRLFSWMIDQKTNIYKRRRYRKKFLEIKY